jgi:hypothetical protein
MKFKDGYQSQDDIKLALSKIRRVLSVHSSINAFTFRIGADSASRKAWDLSLTVDFSSVEDFEHYQRDQDHSRLMDEFLVPRLAVIKAWNFSEAK